MRELKFRVWSEDQKTYDYKFPYNSIGDFYVSTHGVVYSDFGNTVAPEVRQKAFVIEQYTGLKDKNGKEIYEGDIVLIAYQGRTPYVVIYREEDCSFVCNNEFIVDYFHLFKGVPQCYEVIGNIHENPELVEEE